MHQTLWDTEDSKVNKMDVAAVLKGPRVLLGVYSFPEATVTKTTNVLT